MLVYEDAPKPEPKDDEVLIKIEAAGINPVDWMIGSGKMEAMASHALPLILGWDAAGTVEAVGAGVSTLKAGDAVFAFADIRVNGAYAEYLTLPAALVCAKPAALDFAAATAVPLAGITAWEALFEQAALTGGQTILIHGAGGAVGAFAVQFAKVTGATVIATATGSDIDYVRGLGADVVVDYKTEKFEDQAKNVDAVLGTVSGETQARSWATFRDSGVLVSTLPPVNTPAEAAGRGIQGKTFGAHPDGGYLTEIGKLIDAGKVKVRVGATFSLSEAKQAQEQAQGGHTSGKIVLKV